MACDKVEMTQQDHEKIAQMYATMVRIQTLTFSKRQAVDSAEMLEAVRLMESDAMELRKHIEAHREELDPGNYDRRKVSYWNGFRYLRRS